MKDVLDDFLSKKNNKIEFTYASFGRRYVALNLDIIIAAIVFYCPVYFWYTDSLFPRNFSWDAISSALTIHCIMGLFIQAYIIMFETSKLQATPGKFLMNIKVVNLKGDRINFKEALIRRFSHAISAIFYIGYFMMLFNNKNQTLHDKLAGCLIIKPASRNQKKRHSKSAGLPSRNTKERFNSENTEPQQRKKVDLREFKKSDHSRFMPNTE